VRVARTPSGRERHFERDATGRIIAVSQGEDRWQQSWAHDQVKTETHPDGVRFEFGYDALGRLVSERCCSTSGEVRETTWTRDAEGRITAVDGPGGLRERFDHLPEGQPVRLTSGSRTARRRYTGPGRLVEHEDPLGRRTQLTYDGEYRVLSIRQPGDRVWTYGRDKLGRVTRMRMPDGTQVRYVLDPAGNQVEEHRPGQTIRRFYNANDQMTKAVFGPLDEIRIQYDTAGRITEVRGRDDQTIKRTYDADGLLTTEVQGEEAIRWKYDQRGRLVRRSTTWGSTTRLAWGGEALVGLIDPAGGEHRFSRDAWGRRHRWRQPEGTTRRRTWDERDRFVQDALELPGGEVATDRRLFWSDDDTIVGMEERSPGFRRRHAYRYDDLGRLVGHRQDDHDEESWRYDDAGNTIEAPGQAARQFAGGRLEADEAGRRYHHDSRGRVTRITTPAGPVRLWFDARDRLVRVHTADDRVVHHRYDAVGRRVETLAEQADGQVTQEHFYWQGQQLIRRVVQGGGRRDEEYVFDPEAQFVPLMRRVDNEKAKKVEYFHTDQRGAVIELRDPQGQVTWATRYDTSGQVEAEPGGEQPLRLAGQLHDRATGLAHHRFRVFDPAAGCFLTPDPLGPLGGETEYGYPSDPVRLADPLGLSPCDDADPAFSNRMRVQLQKGHTHIANGVIESNRPITAVQVEQATIAMGNALGSGKGTRQVTDLGDGARMTVEVHEDGYGGVTPRVHGAGAQMSKTMRERVVPNGGVEEGGNPRWGREQLRGRGEGIRLDLENLAGRNLQSNR
jgi:RHS repeat-associated protein